METTMDGWEIEKPVKMPDSVRWFFLALLSAIGLLVACQSC